MEKVIIIGCPGSGKSTFARELHGITQLPLYHLDLLYWNADRTTVSKEVFLERLAETMQKPKWIIDGNYSSTMEWRMAACDTVFFLDYPTEICLQGIEARRGQARSDLPWIESDTIDPEFSDFVRKYHTESRPDVIRLLKTYSEKNVFVFRSRQEADAYLSRQQKSV